MQAEELLQAGRPDEALDRLQQAVRKEPGSARLRVFLFQLLCVQGQWDRALTQLQVLAGLDAESMLLAQIFRPVIQCEVLRAEIFAGRRAPLIFGEPQDWMSWLVQADALAAQGKWKAAAELRDRAFEAAPATPGKRGDNAFAWLADADPRLGPVLEVFLDGKYYWVPFCRVKQIAVEKPKDLRDLVWVTAQFTWTNGGAAPGFIPVRYPGTESAGDARLRLSRTTEWTGQPGGYFLGTGQRMLATDEGEFPLLEAGQIQFDTAQATAS